MPNGTINYDEETKKALSQPYRTDTGDSTVDYYNALKNESYKQLLNSEVQASIARDQALKYTNNTLAAKGYANQGMAESTGLGLQSQYQTALSNAANQYRTDMAGINQQQRDEELKVQDDNFKSLTTLMDTAAQSGDKNQLDNVLRSYGYKINEDGTLDLSNSTFDENSNNQLKTLYSLYNASLSTKPGLNSLEDLNNQTYIRTGGDRKGVAATLGENFGNLMKAAWHKVTNGEYTDGSVVKVTNGDNETIYLKCNNGGFTMITENEYDTANATRHTMKWVKNEGIKYN